MVNPNNQLARKGVSYFVEDARDMYAVEVLQGITPMWQAVIGDTAYGLFNSWSEAMQFAAVKVSDRD